MKNFVERFPQFREESSHVKKHVNLMTEINYLVDKFKLLEVSKLEQDIAVNEDKNNHFHVFLNIEIKRIN